MSQNAPGGHQNRALGEEDQRRLITLWEFAVVLERYLGALPQAGAWKDIVADRDGFLTACGAAAAVQPELQLREIRLLSQGDPVLRNTFGSEIGREIEAMQPRRGWIRRVLKTFLRSYRRPGVADVGELITGVIASVQLLADTVAHLDHLPVCEIRSESGGSVRVVSGRSLRKKIREAISTLQDHVEILTYIQQSIAKLAVIVYERDRPEAAPRRIHLQASVQETYTLRMQGRLPENEESYASVSSRIVSESLPLS